MGVWSDFIAGCLSGVAGMVVEYPFDTVKVLLQSHPTHYSGYGDCIARVWRNEGVAGFYRGVSARLLASGFDHAVVFVFYKWTLRAVGADEESPRGRDILVGGLGCGTASAACLTPFELVKCRMQADEGGVRYRGSIDCARQIFAAGGVRGLYSGAWPMLAREVPGTTAWCGTFDLARRWLCAPGETPATLPLWKVALAGGLSGVSFWTILFPADVIKTRVQVDPALAGAGMLRTARVVYAESGVRGLYRGWALTAARSFPSNAIIFIVFDRTVRACRPLEDRLLWSSP